MANFNNIKHEIDQNVNTNGQQAITGAILNTTLKDMLDEVNDKKQDTLTAGSGISISGNVISATGGSGATYTEGPGINIDSNNVISVDLPGIAGHGLQDDGEGHLDVDPSDLAGSGLDAANGVLNVDASEIASDLAGNGLQVDENGALELELKTINGNSLIGTGDLVISGGSGLWQSGSGTDSLVAPISANAGLTAAGDGALIAARGDSSATGRTSASFGFDNKATGENSFVAGNHNEARGADSAAFGHGLYTRSAEEFAVGQYNSSHTYSSAQPWTTRFSIGNGSNYINPSNALEVRDNGKVFVNGIGGYAGSSNDNTSNSLQEVVNGKQDTLVSGVNIKTINGNTILGSGDLTISGGQSYSAGDFIDITSGVISVDSSSLAGNGLTTDSNGALEVDNSVVATQTDLSSYLRNDAYGVIQNFLDSTGDTYLTVMDGYGEDYVKLVAFDTPGVNPHVEIYENGSGDTKFFYDHMERGSQISIDYPTSSGTLALTSDIAGKQDTLTAGLGIDIDANNEISVDASDLDGNGLTVDANGALAVDTTTIQEKLTAGSGISISGNTISATGGGGSGLWVSGTGTDSLLSPGAANNHISYANGQGAINAGNYTQAGSTGGFPSAASGAYSAVFGTNTSATGDNAASFGYRNRAGGDNAFSVGEHCQATGNNSFAGGTDASAFLDHTFAWNGSALSQNAIAMGFNSSATGQHSVAIGSGATTDRNYGLALGLNAHASGTNSAAVGMNVETGNVNETALGAYNKTYDSLTYSSDADRTHFTIGNGTSSNSCSNVLEIKNNDDVYLVGVGNYDGTNARQAGVQTLQAVINAGGGQGTVYSAGAGIDIDANNEISVDASDLDGNGLTVDGNGALAVDTTVVATQSDLSGKQDALTAGSNIQISGTTISATDTTYSAGSGLSLNGTTFSVDTTTIQEKLTAGTGISISGNTISATGGAGQTLGAGLGIDIDANDDINIKVEQGGGLDFNASDELALDYSILNGSLDYLPLTGGTLQEDPNNSTQTILDIQDPSQTAYITLTSETMPDPDNPGGPDIPKATILISDSGIMTIGSDGITDGSGYKCAWPALSQDTTFATLDDISGGGSYLPLTGGALQETDPNLDSTALQLDSPTGSVYANLNAQDEAGDIGTAYLDLHGDDSNASAGDTYGVYIENKGNIEVAYLDENGNDDTATLVLPQTSGTLATLNDIPSASSLAGDGLQDDGNGAIEVKLGSGLQFDANGAIETTGGGSGTAYTAGVGIDIDANNEISSTTFKNGTGSDSIMSLNATSATGPDSVAIGYHASAVANNACAFGPNASARANGAVAVGGYVNGYYGFAGPGAMINGGTQGYGVALGYNATVDNNWGVAIGEGTYSRMPNEFAIGVYNKYYNSNNTSERVAFSIGNGGSSMNRSNAFEIKANNDIYVVGVGGFDGTNAASATTLQDAIANAGGGGGNYLPLEGGTLQEDPNNSSYTSLYVQSPNQMSTVEIHSEDDGLSDSEAYIEVNDTNGSTKYTSEGIEVGGVKLTWPSAQNDGYLVSNEDLYGYLPLAGGTIQYDDPNSSDTDLMILSPNAASSISFTAHEDDPGNTNEGYANMTISDEDANGNSHTAVSTSTGITDGNYTIAFPTLSGDDTFALLSDIQGGGLSAGSGIDITNGTISVDETYLDSVYLPIIGGTLENTSNHTDLRIAAPHLESTAYADIMVNATTGTPYLELFSETSVSDDAESFKINGLGNFELGYVNGTSDIIELPHSAGTLALTNQLKWEAGTGTNSMISAGGVASGLATATNTGSISAGYDTDATGLYAAAFGGQALASGDYSFAAANGSASGDYSSSFGTSASTANYAFSAGNGSTAAAESSMALGRGVHTTSGNTGEGALGIYNYSEAGLVFTIGCGTADNARENAVAIDASGKIFIKGLGGYTGTSTSGCTDLATFINNL